MGALATLWALARTPFGMIVVGVLLAIAGLTALDLRAQRRAAAEIAAKIERIERTTRHEAQTGIDDVRGCAAAGRVWDGAAGRCGRSLRADGP